MNIALEGEEKENSAIDRLTKPLPQPQHEPAMDHREISCSCIHFLLCKWNENTIELQKNTLSVCHSMLTHLFISTDFLLQPHCSCLISAPRPVSASSLAENHENWEKNNERLLFRVQIQEMPDSCHISLYLTFRLKLRNPAKQKTIQPTTKDTSP